jgi:hypothetical protein
LCASSWALALSSLELYPRRVAGHFQLFSARCWNSSTASSGSLGTCIRARLGGSSARPVVRSWSDARSSVFWEYTQKLPVMSTSTPAPSSHRHFRSRLVSPISRLNAL